MNIKILGSGITKFGEHWDLGLSDLALQAASEAIKDAEIDISAIEAIYVSNMLSGKLDEQDQLGSLVSSSLKLHVPATRIEAACASGGVAIHQAVQAILSQMYKTVLVIGVEKMTDVTPDVVTTALMGAGSKEERMAGLTFPGLYALITKAHMLKYGTTKEHLAGITVKNHFHASLNEKAQFPFEVSLERALRSTPIADPLTLFDASPITDGAAAVILTSANRNRKKLISIKASSVATDTLSLSERENITEFAATKIAGQKAMLQAGVSYSDIDVLEVHDCFTIAEILALEDLGFCKKGESSSFIAKGHTKLGGRLPVNTSGGLKACGHPIGATGVKQIAEITHQLQGRGGAKQVKGAKVGLCHNVGGIGATVAVHILQK